MSVSDLFQYFCDGNRKSKELAVQCHDYFSENSGKDLVFLFDGFDELSIELQTNNLISMILNRKLLPNCSLIVTSRPHATAYLREQATVRVNILGFTEIERNHFIQQALKDQPQSIKELTQYLEHHFIISSLCVVPFNMAVLLFLYNQGVSFPKNSTELYNHFICLTICRHLAKHGYILDNTITCLTNLPDPCNEMIQYLSKLSLEALNSNKLVFTFDEINAACPGIATIPGAINGFGLLQAVQHFGLTGKTMTFSFLHFTIQEFLAAYHITNLSPSEELKILKQKFWSDIHSNMFAIYITLTKGQRPSFKQFIKPSLSFGQWIKGFITGYTHKQVTNQFFGQEVRCFHLFRCFFEAGDKETCNYIENLEIFNSRTISTHIDELSPNDIECLTVFLTCSSHRVWKELNLYHCYIQDLDVHILHHGLTSCDVTITTLWFSYNNLTHSSSAAISDITISCKAKALWINGNRTIGEDEKLYAIISDPSSLLEELCMTFTTLSSDAAIKLFTALSEGKKLKTLYINNNEITDEACDTIIMAMKKNTSLSNMRIHNNPISRKCVQLIVQALQFNNTLQQLVVSHCCEHIQEQIGSLVEEVNKKREAHECKLKLKSTIYNLQTQSKVGACVHV